MKISSGFTLFLLCLLVTTSSMALVLVDSELDQVNEFFDELMVYENVTAIEDPLVLAQQQFESVQGYNLVADGHELILKIELATLYPGTESIAISFGYFTRTDKIESYLIRDNTIIWHGLTGSMVPAEERQIHYRYPVFIIPLDEKPATLLLRFSTGNIDRFDVTPINHYQHDEAERSFLQSGFLALMIALSIYWAIIAIATGVGYYGIYVLHLISYATYIFLYDGYLLFYSDVTISHYYLRVSTEIALWVTAIFLAEFARRFMNLSEEHGWLNRSLILVVLIGCALMPFSFTQDGIDTLQQYYIMIGISFLLVASTFVSLKGNNAARYFLISFTPMFIAVIYEEFGYLYPEILGEDYQSGYIYYIGSSLQFILLAFGLAALINQERKERDVAIQESLHHLAESNALKDQYSEDLQREIEEQTTEIQDQNQLLQTQTAELENLSEMKTRFFAAASHDLRQPLHAMGLFAAALGKHVTSVEGHTLLQRLNTALVSMTHLFNSLLDVSRLDAGAIEPDHSTTSLDLILAELESEFKPQVVAKGLRFSCIKKNLFVRSDSVLLERILRNLLSNALRYTVEGGIILSCRSRGPKALIQVWDTGPGMSKTQLDSAFDEYVQVQGMNHGGLGLGLSIVKRTAELLGIDVDVRSEAGRGSVFNLWIEQVPVPKIALDENLPEESIPELCVWVVDDDSVVLEAMRILLEDWGSVVSSFASSVEILDHIRTTGDSPDLLIADADLGLEDSGFDLIIEVQGICDCDVALITGDTGQEKLKLAKSRGIPLLHKPVNPAQLRSLLLYAERSRQSGADRSVVR